jgi:predicted nucleic acid-binding protein
LSYPFRDTLLDTSVVVKRFVTEEDSEKAMDIQQAHLRDEIQLHVPDILLMELANALRYSARLSAGRILEDLETFSALGIAIVPFSLEALKSSIALSMERDLAVYDAYFLALAQAMGIPLITADQRMLSRLTAEAGALNLKDI